MRRQTAPTSLLLAFVLLSDLCAQDGAQAAASVADAKVDLTLISGMKYRCVLPLSLRIIHQSDKAAALKVFWQWDPSQLAERRTHINGLDEPRSSLTAFDSRSPQPGHPWVVREPAGKDQHL